MSMTVIEHIEVGSGGAASITFTSIPATYTDLYLLLTVRSTHTGYGSVYLGLNSSTANFSARYLQGNGSSVASGTLARYLGTFVYDTQTSNTFSSCSVMFPNYASSNYKSYSVDSVTENNATSAIQDLVAGLWSDTSAISSMQLTLGAGNFKQYSSATLFGITAGSSGGVTVS